MCGIAGIYRFDKEPVDSGLLQRMTDVISHRGPDDEGHYVDGPVGLGNRRLSIIDLSPNGHMPMSNENGSIWMTYNGETYNFRALKEQLNQGKHQFKSNTDSETVIHAYEERGVDVLQDIKGMYAFALWDSNKQRLLLARDRLGIKPLFYYADENKLLFGSEIKCILEDESSKREVDLEALHHFLSFNYTPAPLTMFAGIKQLLPGQYLIVENNEIQIHEYWDLNFTSTSHTEGEYKERLDQHLFDSVESMLVSDVPFGVFLSGGLDSSVVTHYMSRILDQPVKTFSIGFSESSYNELDKARAVATHCKTEHHEEIVTADDLETLIPHLISHAEEPLADASMIPVYYVSKMAREHVKMVLCGDGADEILAGYETYQANQYAKYYRAIPRFIREGMISPVVNALPVSDQKISLDYKAKRFVKGASQDPEHAHFYWRIIFDEETKRKLYDHEIVSKLNGSSTFEKTFRQYFERTSASSELDRYLYVDTRFYLPNDMLVKVDRMSMANSLEVRVPFLDESLVEFLATVPASLKLKGSKNKKYLLKRVMQDRLPPEILNQRKQGFNIPVGLWLKTRLKEFMKSVLSPERLSEMGLFNQDFVAALQDEHLRGTKDHGYQLWGLLIFTLWWEKFIAQNS